MLGPYGGNGCRRRRFLSRELHLGGCMAQRRTRESDAIRSLAPALGRERPAQPAGRGIGPERAAPSGLLRQYGEDPADGVEIDPRHRLDALRVSGRPSTRFRPQPPSLICTSRSVITAFYGLEGSARKPDGRGLCVVDRLTRQREVPVRHPKSPVEQLRAVRMIPCRVRKSRAGQDDAAVTLRLRSPVAVGARSGALPLCWSR
jgi:hypothetical protein